MRRASWSATALGVPPGVLLFAVLLSVVLASCRGRELSASLPEEREAEEWFIRYLRIDTSNPPGRETDAARFFQEFFAREGIEHGTAGPSSDRQSVWARLRSGKSAPALVLMHHLDVVPAEPSEWSVPPFSGERANGYIWGRGALDIKSLGIAELSAFLELARNRSTLERDVVFLGVADEEAGGMNGTGWLLANRPDLFEGVGVVLNEGGANEVIVDRVAYWGIEVDQKIPLWVRISTTGARGHGAVPPDDGGAVARLVDILGEVRDLSGDSAVVPSVDAYFRSLSTTKKGRKREMLSDIRAHFESPELERVLPPGYRSLMRETIALTHISAGKSVNVVPGRAFAELDIRLLPGSSPDRMIERIRTLCRSRAEVEVLLRSDPAPPSPVDAAVFRQIAGALVDAEPGSVAGTLVTPGTTDCRYFRARGIPCYGISPFKVNYYDGNNVHGVDEKIRIRFFAEGVALMRRVVRMLATSSWTAADLREDDVRPSTVQ